MKDLKELKVGDNVTFYIQDKYDKEKREVVGRIVSIGKTSWGKDCFNVLKVIPNRHSGNIVSVCFEDVVDFKKTRFSAEITQKLKAILRSMEQRKKIDEKIDELQREKRGLSEQIQNTHQEVLELYAVYKKDDRAFLERLNNTFNSYNLFPKENQEIEMRIYFQSLKKGKLTADLYLDSQDRPFHKEEYDRGRAGEEMTDQMIKENAPQLDAAVEKYFTKDRIKKVRLNGYEQEKGYVTYSQIFTLALDFDYTDFDKWVKDFRATLENVWKDADNSHRRRMEQKRRRPSFYGFGWR